MLKSFWWVILAIAAFALFFPLYRAFNPPVDAERWSRGGTPAAPSHEEHGPWEDYAPTAQQLQAQRPHQTTIVVNVPRASDPLVQPYAGPIPSAQVSPLNVDPSGLPGRPRQADGQ